MQNSVKIVCEDIWKVFGKKAEKVINASTDYDALAKSLRCTVAVREANFSVQEGEVFVVMGLSGSGKSTLLRCINRLIEPSRGRIVVDGEDLKEMNKGQLRQVRQKKMGMVFQHFALLPYRNILDNAAFGLEVQGLSKQERHKQAAEALDLVGLGEWAKYYPHELSGGMQQRVGLARALALNPEILLMDEAFSALDPLIRQQMQDEFLKLVDIVKKTIVFITHDLDEALKLADRIVVMKDGRIVQIGTPEEIVMEPADDYVAEFVSSVSQTKVISARNLMMKPDQWMATDAEDPAAILVKMLKNDIDSIFITNSTGQLVGVLNQNGLSEYLKNNSKSLESIVQDNYPSVLPDAALEGLISEAARTKHPIAVLDSSKHLLGVISRTNLLEQLTSVI